MKLATAVLTFALLAGSRAQLHGPVFLLEPPSRLAFSNSSGASAACAAHGQPPPRVRWLLHDNSPADDVPGLRHALDNGTLVFGAFLASQYRQDVHAATYRCRATNAAGIVVSRDMLVSAVIWQEYRVSVSGTRVSSGAVGVLACIVPASVRDHVHVAAWYRDETVLLPASGDLNARHLVTDGGWRLIVRDVRAEDSRAQFACLALDTLTGERRRSPPAHLDIIPEPQGPYAPRSSGAAAATVTVKRGTDAHITCAVHAKPAPTITWYRAEGLSGSMHEVVTSSRVQRSRDVLVVRRAESTDDGRWACRARNVHGQLTLETMLIVRVSVTVHLQPQLQIVNSGASATLNCTVSGSPEPRVEWLHNGSPLSGGGAGGARLRMLGAGGARALRVESVRREDAGMYQCVARNEHDSAQASAELRLGDTAPELQYTFIEQALRPGPEVSLRCSAVGSPAPHFIWLLDGQPLNTMTRGLRYTIGQYVTKGGDVVGHLNISNVRSEDGGLYSCKASNSLGEVLHTARLNIYGPPYVRSIGPIRAVAGREIVLYCPYSGYPISSVRWEHVGGAAVSESGRGSEGSLHIVRVDASHAGAYACTVTGPRGEIARRDLQLLVNNPPEIEPFSFPANLQEGKRAQVSCSVTSGDMPVYFSWYKDNSPIPATLQVEERGADFFSNLVFKEVSSHHSGVYTCVASNSAAKVNFSTELVVKVSPKWISEPMDASTLAGETLALHCQTRGSPTPQITWLKQNGNTGTDFMPLVNLGGRFQFMSNGSLWIEAASPYDEGQYMCKADNGIGVPLSKTIYVSVNEPARFELTSRNVTARRETAATLLCDVLGDHPIQVQWTHDMNRLDLNTYRLSISEVKTENGLRSQLYISRTDRQDSGVYKCQAVNAFGHSDYYIYLSIQEKPDPPHSVSVIDVGSQSVRLSWSQGFDGNSPLVGYTVQYDVLNTVSGQLLRPNQWENAVTQNISVHSVLNTGSRIGLSNKGDNHYEALVEGLKPHTAYMVRLSAINQIDSSDYTESVVVKTQEEAPSSPPQAVAVVAGGAGELHVSWRPPLRDSWNGELLGYTVTWSTPDDDTADSFSRSGNWSSRRSQTVNGWSAGELALAGLRKFTRYDVRVRAFNGVAAGPPSAPVSATTLEGVPESPPTNVACNPLSSVSIKVTWSPPPPGQHGGLIQGYKVLYTPQNIDQEFNMGEVKRITSTETYLHALHKFTNYSVQVLAFTAAGDGKRSRPVYCVTEEDVPSPPQKIKALALSAESVLVSWLAPLQPNGVISQYTVYHREAGRINKHTSYTVSVDKMSDMELIFEARNLVEHQLYEFWVSATSGSGEGDPTPVVAQGANARAPARIASFGGRVVRGAGGSALLRCVAVGNPAPRSRWLHRTTPVTHAPRYQVTPHGHLHIHNVDIESSGNFTCTASNLFGEDSIVYSVVAILPPAPPALGLQYTTASTIKIHWQPAKDGGSAILGYILSYKAEQEKVWQALEVSAEANTFTLESLRCGTKYNINMQAKNRIAVGPHSPDMTASTRGAAPKAPKNDDLVTTNSTAIKLNLYSWRDGGCPLLGFTAEYRRVGAGRWEMIADNLAVASHVIGDLHPATWYEVRVKATNDAGVTQVQMFVDTMKLNGGRIPPLEPSSSLSGGDVNPSMSTVLLSSVACVVVLVTAVAAILCALQGRKKLVCWSSNDYIRDDRKLSESNEAEREKLREGQKLYSSSSINGHEKSNDDSSELYEISPYATFGLAGSQSTSGASGGAHSLHFRTFGALDDDAAPSLHHHRPKHRHAHRCDTYQYDESTLSKSTTVEARHRFCKTGGLRAPDVNCDSVRGWDRRKHARDPPTTTDEDDNSDSAGNTTIKGSRCVSPLANGGALGGVGGGGGAGCNVYTPRKMARCSSGVLGGGAGLDGLPAHALSPLSHTRSPAPNDISSMIDKYQQRKEQERRECTIHV